MVDPAGFAPLLGQPVQEATRLGGGSLSAVYLLRLGDGSTAVAKTGAGVGCEARMLGAMANAGAPVPAILASTDNTLILQYLQSHPPDAAEWQSLGTGLRRLHRSTQHQFGWPEDYAFGPVAIRNTPCRNWPEFWADNRLLPFCSGLAPELAHRVEALCGALPNLLPAQPRPALLHGDLWTGNVLFGPDGTAHMIDPACYYGHGEVDLAMLHLFATPDAAFQAAYGALQAGWQVRRPIYALWPALVHLRLFGDSYAGLVNSCLRSAGY